jgi:DNA-binding beta-propeller fold protein YncE
MKRLSSKILNMAVRTLLGLGLGLVAAQYVNAEIMVVGIDRKFAYDQNATRQALAPGHDAVMFFDLKNPAKPQLIGSIALENSILGPPTNVAITPDESMALVANSVHSEQTETGWKAVPANELFVIDLKSSPPRLLQTLELGRQPSGLSISRDGKLVLVANRDSKTISVLAIRNGLVSLVDTFPTGDSVGSVAITPDGHHAVATTTLTHKLMLLNISDDLKLRVERELWVGLFPWNVAMAPDGRSALVNNIGNAGQSDGSAKTVSVIDLAGPQAFVREHVSVGDAPEGVAYSPNGKFAAVTILQGSYDAPQTAWFKKEAGAATLLAVSEKSTRVANSVPVGAFPEGIAFAADNQHVYVGNFRSNSISILKVNEADRLVDTGHTIELPGPPASLRIGSR